LGLAFGGMGEHGKETECYQRALELNPKNADIWYNMGVAHYELGEYKKAIEYQKKAVEIDPEHAFAWLFLKKTENNEITLKLIKEILAKISDQSHSKSALTQK